MRKIYYLFILCVGFSTCSEPYDHEINDFEDILIVQGLLTNDIGPYSVYLSKTISLGSDSLIFVQDAIVTIMDQLGNVELLTEVEPGHYITDPGFITNIGYEYQLSIKTTDDLQYISDPVALNEGPTIDRLYTEYKEEYHFETNEYLKGVSIKANSTNWNNDQENLYFKWDYEETWELEQRWNGFEFFLGESPLVDYSGGNSDEVCWSKDYSTDIILDEMANFSSNNINGKEIVYLNELNYKPFYGYSILVKQFIINESIYKFWTFLKENNIENGDVFDNIPYNATSNIECINNKDEKVYGYFDAAYRSEKRLSFISPVHDVAFANINDRCRASNMELATFKQQIFGATPIYAITISLVQDDERIIFTHQKYCVDCLEICSTENKPSYWIF